MSKPKDPAITMPALLDAHKLLLTFQWLQDGLHLGHGALLLHQLRGRQVTPGDLQHAVQTMVAGQDTRKPIGVNNMRQLKLV